MAEQTIVFAQGIEMPPDILEQVRQMKPAGFTLHMLPPGTSAAETAVAIREAEYLLGFPRFLPDEAYTEAKRLKLVQVLSAGYDYVNIAGARKARIPICSNGGANSVAVAEHAIMLMLAVYRKLVTFHQNVAAGRWHQGVPRTVNIYEMEGKTVGLVGLGNIGRQVARRVKAFDAQVIYYDALRRSPQEERELGVRYVPLDTLLATADIVSLHVPLNESTRRMINAQAFGRMKPTTILINTCRGEVVDERALIEALQQGRILAAGLDTQEKEPPDPHNPLLTLPNVTLTPHSAGPTVDSFRKRFHNGYANIERVARGQPPLWVIPEMHDLFPAATATE
ncbi:MAG TPA: 2-hydroxyacid dehydrogenase [Candidatus Binatia bacterium]|jgi:phosphoglycerate dehydrogenase-like enzyme|nr:2-hydroxyacid dehydrogenase [Candidatus Binatia bacterium]